MRSQHCYIVVGMLLAVGPLLGQERGQIAHTIDLVADPPVVNTGGTGASNPLQLGQPIGALSDGPKKASEIQVETPSIDRRDYRAGDQFVYELYFENVASHAIKFPTLVNGENVDRDMPGAAMASVSLMFEDEALGLQLVGAHALYGADAIPGSLITVQPGQRVRVRAPGNWVMLHAGNARLGQRWTRPLHLRATVQLVGRGVTHFIETSKGAVPVFLSR